MEVDGFDRQLEKKVFTGSKFLLGPRKVGKSTYLRKNFTKSLYIDLLDNELYYAYSRSLGKMHEFILYQLEKNKEFRKYPVIIDEIQRIPLLLNDVHRLIEEEGLDFILCGF